MSQSIINESLHATPHDPITMHAYTDSHRAATCIIWLQSATNAGILYRADSTYPTHSQRASRKCIHAPYPRATPTTMDTRRVEPTSNQPRRNCRNRQLRTTYFVATRSNVARAMSTELASREDVHAMKIACFHRATEIHMHEQARATNLNANVCRVIHKRCKRTSHMHD